MATLPSLAGVDEHLRRQRLHLLLKRAFDIVFSGLLLLLLSPLLVATAVLIRLTSRGPVLFSQSRWGLREGVFTCYKFRSMVMDHASVMDADELQARQADGTLLKMKRDPRVTWIGGIIRKTSIDELPQLLNVLLGDMSIVGPRPLMLSMLDPYPAFRAVRCRMRPGITGLWQIRDRKNNTSAEFMFEHDVEYVSTFSIWLDLKILASTVPVVLQGEGAY